MADGASVAAAFCELATIYDHAHVDTPPGLYNRRSNNLPRTKPVHLSDRRERISAAWKRR